MAIAELDKILDLDTLEQYCGAIGAATLLKSVVLFEQLMPEYVAGLLKAKEAGDKNALCAEAHKFKGAAGSVGLKRLQQYAQLLQQGDAPGWESGHLEWLTEISAHAFKDLAALKSFLEAKA